MCTEDCTRRNITGTILHLIDKRNGVKTQPPQHRIIAGQLNNGVHIEDIEYSGDRLEDY